MTIAGVLGNLIFSAYVQAFSMLYPFMPVYFQAINVCLWVINVYLMLVSDLRLLFIWMMFIGGLSGASFTNFLFLANAKTNLPCDMNLQIYDRELTVNLFLISFDIGMFYGFLFTY